MAAKDQLVIRIQTPVTVVIHDQQRVVGGQTAELVDLGPQALARPLHGDQELAALVAVALERLADPAGLVLEGDVVDRLGRRVRGLLEVVEGPCEDEDVDLGILGLDWASESADG